MIKEIVSVRLKVKKRTYACFVDFSKCFDSVDRTLLMVKLQMLGIPYDFCNLCWHIFMNTTLSISSGGFSSIPFKTSLGLFQGDTTSAVLFNLFVSDLPDSLAHSGVQLNGKNFKFLQYADDVCLLGDSADDLQIALDSISLYCEENKLAVNVAKTKAMVFHRGRLPECEFYYNGAIVERVKHFKYLGVTLSQQLSFTTHLCEVTKKARARWAFLYPRLKLTHLPLELMKRAFDCFIIPMFSYALPVYITNVSQGAQDSVNSFHSSLLKRYLCVPPTSNTALAYYITNEAPLMSRLQVLNFYSFFKVTFPSITVFPPT